MKQLDLLIRLYNNQLFFDEMTAEVIHIYRDDPNYIFYTSVYASGILE